MFNIKPFNFKEELSHPMTAITMQDMNCQQTSGIKFKIPILMTDISDLTPMESKHSVNTSHIVNTVPVQSEKYETCNYVLLNVPQEFAFMCPRSGGDIVKKHQEFIAVCMDGELENIRIIGRNF